MTAAQSKPAPADSAINPHYLGGHPHPHHPRTPGSSSSGLDDLGAAEPFWSLPRVFPQTLSTTELIQELSQLYTIADLQMLDHVELISRYLDQVRPKPRWEIADFPPISRPFIQEILPEFNHLPNSVTTASSLISSTRKREHHQINAKSPSSKSESATKRPKITWP